MRLIDQTLCSNLTEFELCGVTNVIPNKVNANANKNSVLYNIIVSAETNMTRIE